MALLPARRQKRADALTRPFEQLHNELDTLFQRFFGGWMSPSEEDFGTMHVWDFDVTEGDKEIVVRAELPGFNEKELDVQLNDNLLTIKAERKEESDKERSYRSFRRTVTLPPGIDPGKVQATYRNGVLELRIPTPEGSKARRIPVKT
jgi:HSP20 family protein